MYTASKPLPFLLHEARRRKFPSLSCPALVMVDSNGFVHIFHTIDTRNSKIALETYNRCKCREQKHLWLKDKWADLSRPFWVKAMLTTEPLDTVNIVDAHADLSTPFDHLTNSDTGQR